MSVFFGQTELLAAHIRSKDVYATGIPHYIKETALYLHYPHAETFTRALDIAITSDDGIYDDKDRAERAISSIVSRLSQINNFSTLPAGTVYTYAYALKTLGAQYGFSGIIESINKIIADKPNDGNQTRRNTAIAIKSALTNDDDLLRLESLAISSYNAYVDFLPEDLKATYKEKVELEIVKATEILTNPSIDYLKEYTEAVRGAQSDYREWLLRVA